VIGLSETACPSIFSQAKHPKEPEIGDDCDSMSILIPPNILANNFYSQLFNKIVATS
jgi:hypothetical protein